VTDWLLGTLLATSGLILLVLLVREPVRRHFGARVAYGLWLIPAARLLMPALTRTVERPVSETVAARPMPSEVLAQPMLMSNVTTPEPSLMDQIGGWSTILLVVWLGVAFGLFAGRILAYRRQRAAILGDAAELGRIGSVRLVQSAEVSGPLAFGIVDRVIAVPADFGRLYAEREQRLALEHELAHHRSGDLIVNLVAFGLLCLQWFNPLAWMAHAAFRFDQEAACDARVLDKAKGEDRSEYGRAIAKAVSGRALLFASALDRPKTLQRRLKSMLSNPSSGRRLTGRILVLASVGIALPLTATRAIDYVDVAAPAAPTPAVAPEARVAPVAVVQGVQAIPALAPVARGNPVPQIHLPSNFDIDGRTRDWEDMTPEEKAEVRRSIDEARAELAKVNGAEIQRQVQEAMAEAAANREDYRRDMADARREVDEAMREIDANSAELRRAGQDPEQIKATVRASLKSVEAIDVDAITRQALASVHPGQIAATMAAAQDGLRQADAALKRAERVDQKNLAPNAPAQ
jgi:bla regulator protein BlaR1